MDNNRSNSLNSHYAKQYHPYSYGNGQNHLRPSPLVNTNFDNRLNTPPNKTAEFIHNSNVFQGGVVNSNSPALPIGHAIFKQEPVSSLFCDVMYGDNCGQHTGSLAQNTIYMCDRSVYQQRNPLASGNEFVPLTSNFIPEEQPVFAEKDPMPFSEVVEELIEFSPSDLQTLGLAGILGEENDIETIKVPETQGAVNTPLIEPIKISSLITTNLETIELIKQLKKNPVEIDCQTIFPHLKHFMAIGFGHPLDMMEAISEKTCINFFGANEDYMQEKIESCLSAFNDFAMKIHVFPETPTKTELVTFVMSKIILPQNSLDCRVLTSETVGLVRSLYLKYPIFNKNQMAEFILKISPKIKRERRERFKAELVEVIEAARKSLFPKMMLYSPGEIEGDNAVQYFSGLLR